MKKYKSLIIYYVLFITLSLISLFSFKQKGNDIFIALSSISADMSLVFAIIIVIYALLLCCNKNKKELTNINKTVLSSLLILFITMLIVFISFINIYSHRNVFEYIIRVINKKENLDILILFLESLFVYFFIYLSSLNGIVLSNIYNKKRKLELFPFIVITIMLLLIIVLIAINIKWLLFMWIIDLILYITSILLIKKYK